MIKYLVVWTTIDSNACSGGQTNDDYEAFASLAEARDKYIDLVHHEDTYSATICTIVESTDYEPTTNHLEEV